MIYEILNLSFVVSRELLLTGKASEKFKVGIKIRNNKTLKIPRYLKNVLHLLSKSIFLFFKM